MINKSRFFTHSFYLGSYKTAQLIGIIYILRKIWRSCQPTCDRIILSNWSHNLRQSDQKVIQPSYDGNIILTWYMIYHGRISRPRREPISIRAGFRTFVKRSSLIGRAVVAPSFVSSRPRVLTRYQKSLVARWRTYPADEKLSIRPEANQTTIKRGGSFMKTTSEIYREMA